MASLMDCPDQARHARDPGPAPLVLVIADDPLERAFLEALLSQQGLTVTGLARHQVNPDRLAEIRPALILLDTWLTDGHGFELLSQLRAQADYALLPIVLLSPQRQLGLLSYAFALGATDVICKPCRPAELVLRLQHHLEIWQSLAD